jgi:hypothetical protein
MGWRRAGSEETVKQAARVSLQAPCPTQGPTRQREGQAEVLNRAAVHQQRPGAAGAAPRGERTREALQAVAQCGVDGGHVVQVQGAPHRGPGGG